MQVMVCLMLQQEKTMFLAYGNFKKELGISYAKQLASHRKHYNECAKKMLILHENKK